jgi:hypothetical protein
MARIGKITPLPDDHHVSRFVPYRRQHRDFETDQILGAFTTAFELRKEDKGGLSVTWVEHFGPLSGETCAAAANAYRKSTRDKKLSGNALFAIGQVGRIKQATKRSGAPARVVHEPTKHNRAHAAIRRIDKNEVEVLDAMAQQAFAELRDKSGNVVCSSPAMGVPLA